MAYGNTVNLTGNLTRDPEVTFTTSGLAVCNMGVAWNQYKGPDADEIPHFFDVVAFDSLAENIADSLNKGDRVSITGRLSFRTYESKTFTDKNGNPANQRAVEIIADDVSPSLRWAVASVTRNEKTNGNGRADSQADAAGKVLVPDEEPF